MCNYNRNDNAIRQFILRVFYMFDSIRFCGEWKLGRDKCNDVDEKYLLVAKLSCQQEASERVCERINELVNDGESQPASQRVNCNSKFRSSNTKWAGWLCV